MKKVYKQTDVVTIDLPSAKHLVKNGMIYLYKKYEISFRHTWGYPITWKMWIYDTKKKITITRKKEFYVEHFQKSKLMKLALFIIKNYEINSQK